MYIVLVSTQKDAVCSSSRIISVSLLLCHGTRPSCKGGFPRCAFLRMIPRTADDQGQPRLPTTPTNGAYSFTWVRDSKQFCHSKIPTKRERTKYNEKAKLLPYHLKGSFCVVRTKDRLDHIGNETIFLDLNSIYFSFS